MDLFVVNEEVDRLVQRLDQAAPHQKALQLALSVSLAWHLRQRDTARALRWADQARGLLQGAQRDDPSAAVLGARLKLVYGEAQWLQANLDEAHALAQRAFDEFEALLDPLGCADARYLQGCIQVDRGDVQAHGIALTQCIELSQTDPLRQALFEVDLARHDAFRDWHIALQKWQHRIPAPDAQLPLALRAAVFDYLSAISSFSGDPAAAFGHALHGFNDAMQTGQIRRAIVSASNVGYELSQLNDSQGALEWMQRGLDVARPTGWPGPVGRMLQQTADILLRLGRLDAAQEMLDESFSTLAPLQGSRAYVITLCVAADLAHAQGRFDEAYQYFCQVQAHARHLDQLDFHLTALAGQASNLFKQDCVMDALQVAHEALALARAQHDVVHQIGLLRLLADIHASQPLPPLQRDEQGELNPHPQLEASSAPLHYLQQALSLANSIEGYSVTGDLLDALAREYANQGAYMSAYNISQQAHAAREKLRGQKATSLSVAMQVQLRTEQAKAESEHHRQLAAAEAQRAEILQQTGMTLMTLGAIGQEITANLDDSDVFQALDRHVHSLLDATSFMVYLLDARGESLEMVFGVEEGQSMPRRRVDMANSPTHTARCARERREFKLDIDAQDADGPRRIPGTLPTRSLLFAPLVVHDRLLGVMSLQTVRPHAYGEREQLIFRNLCAYGAIALDNAMAYRQLRATLQTLRDTQALLVDKNLQLERANAALEEVSLTDTLTGLRNRRFLQQQLDGDVAITLRHHEEWLRSGMPNPHTDADLIFFMVDLDHFKRVNDVHGHAAGDRLLVQIRARLLEVFRESDYLVRWGGEEFLVVARACQRDEGPGLAERIRAAVAERPFDLGEGLHLNHTCSVGFASFPFSPEQAQLLSWQQVVQIADQALYMAKRSGRNAWVGLAHPPATPRNEDWFHRLQSGVAVAVQSGDLRVMSSVSPLVLDAFEGKPSVPDCLTAPVSD